MSGARYFSEALGHVPDVLSATHQGTLWYFNSVLIAVLGATIFWPSGRLSAFRLSVFSTSLCGIAAIHSSSGHAADQGDFTLDEFAQFLHLSGTAIWAGAVVVSGIVAVPRLARRSPADVWTYGRRLSRLVTVAVAVLLVSGIWTANTETASSLPALISTVWGRILMTKVLLALLALGFGAQNRRTLQRAPDTPAVNRFARLLRIEAVLMLAILSLSALLANLPPPMAGQ